MNEAQKKEVATFRFSIISDLIIGGLPDKESLRILIRQKAGRQWKIPYSERTTISETTIKRWIDIYMSGNQNITTLYPKNRSDSGGSRAMDDETAATLLRMQKNYPGQHITELVYAMEQQGLMSPGRSPSPSTIYRFLKINGNPENKTPKVDRRRFEAEFPNDIWQSDVMHGPKLKIDGKIRKTYLIAFIDDHSRLIANAVFELSENLKCFLKAFKVALLSRGIPRKLYVDNGSAFKSNHLSYIAAALQINLIHAKPYSPQGKGKIERFFKTVRGSFLSGPMIQEVADANHPLMELNEKLSVWLMDRYHLKCHSGTSEAPLERFKNGIEIVRAAPDNLNNYFRLTVMRTVTKDRVVHLNGKLFEAPVDLIGERIELLYHNDDHSDVEARFNGKSYGLLKPVDLGVNVKVRRAKYNAEITLEPTSKHVSLKPGRLFNKKRR